MPKNTKYRAAIFFTILFMAIISAPTIITSFDDSVDLSCFFNMNEEEEESESLKLLFESHLDPSEDYFVLKTRDSILGYTFKTYPKPHLNLVFPPPEGILL